MCSAIPSPMPGSSLSFLSSCGDFFDALRHAVEQLGYFFVAAVAPDDRAVNFEQLRRLAQYLCDVSIFHRRFSRSPMST